MEAVWTHLHHAYRMDETECLKPLMAAAHLEQYHCLAIENQAKIWIEQIRQQQTQSKGLDAFLSQYDLSTEEGIALMSLAEALLRIPDKNTVDKLIKDKIASKDWEQHLGKSASWFVNAATFGLLLSGKVLNKNNYESTSLLKHIHRLITRVGEPIIRKAVMTAMKILGEQFVMGTTIDKAMERAKILEAKGYRYSYDMLGEAAKTNIEADHYFNAYLEAILNLNKNNKGAGPIEGPGISIKLSALHPRFEWNQREMILPELISKIKHLAIQAREANIGFTIDAEEADRLELSLMVIESILQDPIFRSWEGFGLAIQAYQKRGFYVIDWVQTLSEKLKQKLMIRLVKGAYWDSEIKWSQERGLNYPVFTRKISTDVSYLACAKKLFEGTSLIYPQFATHNAYTAAYVLDVAKQFGREHHFEFQALHGMGTLLYQNIVGVDHCNIPCRIYAPVGGHEHLLGYLVRRLLENGANASFVNRIKQSDTDISLLIQNPVATLSALPEKPNPNIPLPKDLYGKERPNSLGVDLTNPMITDPLLQDIASHFPSLFEEPLKHTQVSDLPVLCEQAVKASQMHDLMSPEDRGKLLAQLARLLEEHRSKLLALLIREGGKTVQDAISELREAIDFCWYYRQRVRIEFAVQTFQGPTGELNQMSLHGRGVFVCISPWNFPLAIFLGQILAALTAGNAVIAKPASQTPYIAHEVVKLLHQAGFSKQLIQLVIGSGSEIGNPLLAHPAIRGVMFTGSTETGRQINQMIAKRPGPIIPLIAETGGQNAMIVDSSALPEQVITDVLTSAFNSAGQRCSALRVLFVQQDMSDRLITLLQGAMAEIKIGDPFHLSTDVGPMIDEASVLAIKKHQADMNAHATLIYSKQLPDHVPTLPRGAFFGPCAYEIDNLNRLTQENFGPILHVIRYQETALDKVMQDIRNTGFGLTLGIHSRISSTVDYIVSQMPVGNMYVNRNMIGAVVGVQPFGGEGLSGTGPKAGGPHMLSRLATERTLSVNTAATGGNTTLLSLDD